jgi:hypothetical protein
MRISDPTSNFKNSVHEILQQHIDELDKQLASRPTSRQLELAVWNFLLTLGRMLLSWYFSRRCEMATLDDMKQQGLSKMDVVVRLSADRQASLMTTLGAIRFPTYAYSPRRGTGAQRAKARVPAKAEFLPLYPRCHSSELCLEWETRLGSDHPFRIAQQEMTFFTHGAVTLEDNTINTHVVRAGVTVDRSWLYRSKDEMRRLLKDRATCDLTTGKPLLYISSDAHALRRYVDDTWSAPWKMANGIRLWAIDRDSGEAIHLGGEFCWGDCEHVATIFLELIETGVLPKNGDFGEDVAAQLVWLSDGAPWFEERIVPLFGSNIITILDIYHFLERAAAYAASAFADAKQGQVWYAAYRTALIGSEQSSDNELPKPNNRKGHKKRKRLLDFDQRRREKIQAQERLRDADTADVLVGLLPNVEGERASKAYDDFTSYMTNYSHRIDYFEYRRRGLQIGSGAMESMHRIGSQVRLKRSGVRCLAQTSQAIFDWRMLRLVGRWDEFWSQPNLAKKLAKNWDEEVLDYALPAAA